MFRRLVYRILLAAVFVPGQLNLRAQELSFTRPIDFGSSTSVNLRSAADQTGVYVAGTASAGVSSDSPPGSTAFVRKYDSGGREVWTRRLDEVAVAQGVTVSDTGIYLAGITGWRPASSGVEAGYRQAFLRLYDVDGNELWTRIFGGTASSPEFTAVSAITADSTGVFLALWTGTLSNTNIRGPALVRKYDTQGLEQWTATLAAGYLAAGIAVESGNVYLAGMVSANLSPPRAPTADFVSKYDATGKESWTRQFYTNSGGDYGYPTGVAVSGGDVYVTGRGFLYPEGGAFAFVRAFDGNGQDKWTNQFGGANTQGIVSDGDSVYVAGSVFGVLPGQCSAGSFDAFVRRYDLNGNELWTHQFGSYGSDQPEAIAMDASAVYVSGSLLPLAGSFLSKLEKNTAGSASGPRIQSECVLNAANFLGGGVAPGEIVTILGSSMGPVQAASFVPDANGIVGGSLAGTRVLFNGIAGPMLSSSHDRATAVVPLALGGNPTVDVQVEYQGVVSKPVTLPVLEARPGVFSLDGTGTGQAAVLNQDGSVNSASNPAARGSIISLFATGGGPSDAAVADGQIEAGRIPQLRAATSVVFTDESSLGTADWVDYISIYNQPPFGKVLYAGGAAGLVQGALQINVRLPELPGSQTSLVPMQVFFGGDPANAIASGGSVTIAVR